MLTNPSKKNLLTSITTENIERHRKAQEAFAKSFPEFKKYVIRWSPQTPVKLIQFECCYKNFCANEKANYKSEDEQSLLFEEIYEKGFKWNYEEFYKLIINNVSGWIGSIDLEFGLMDYEIFLQYDLEKIELKSHLKE